VCKTDLTRQYFQFLRNTVECNDRGSNKLDKNKLTYSLGLFTGFMGETDATWMPLVVPSPARGLKSAKSPFALAELKSAKSSLSVTVREVASERRVVDWKERKLVLKLTDHTIFSTITVFVNNKLMCFLLSNTEHAKNSENMVHKYKSIVSTFVITYAQF